MAQKLSKMSFTSLNYHYMNILKRKMWMNVTIWVFCVHPYIYVSFSLFYNSSLLYERQKSHTMLLFICFFVFSFTFLSSFQHRIIWHRLIESSKAVKAPSCKKKRSIIILRDLREKKLGRGLDTLKKCKDFMWNRIWFCLNVLKLFKANWWSRPWFSQSWQEFCVQKFFPLLDSNAQTALTVLNTVSQKFNHHRKKWNISKKPKWINMLQDILI